MEMILNPELSEQSVSEAYRVLDDTFHYGYFYGFNIKNKYDEERLAISNYSGAKRIYFETNNKPYNLYGLLDENPINDTLVRQLDKTPPASIGEYNSKLTLNGLTCFTCFLHFSPGLYPIDSCYAEKFFPGVDISIFNSNKKISKFQRMGHIYLFALVNHKRKK